MVKLNNAGTYEHKAGEHTMLANHVVAVLLAAGFSKRFGSDKRLYGLETQTPNNNKPLLIHTLERILPHFQHLIIVHRFDDEQILALLTDYPVTTIAAPQQPIGLGVSLATAAKYLLNNITEIPTENMTKNIAASVTHNIVNSTVDNPLTENKKQKPTHLMVFLADMPKIDSRTINHLLNQARQNPKAVIRPRYQKHAGHPVCLPTSLLHRLSSLSQDEGAAQLIKTSGTKVIWVDVDDAGVVFDIDTPAQTTLA
ncbi:nucleotidyltransferase family protein [Thalassotalea litorea]|uniref:nucleotidyltransferase family protein n=1 Tax=Thalassotalea litorea TaxID=2020715 RepID=UPI0037365EA3